jgi:hypothetical protein
MKRLFCFVACALALIAVPVVGFSQGMSVPQLGQQIDGWSKPFTDISSAIDNLKVDTCVKVGVKSLNCHFNLPIAAGPPWFGVSEINFPSPVDFDLKKETLSVGSVEFQVQLPRNFSIFLNGEGSVQKTVPVTMGQDPFRGGAAGVVLWNGSKAQWCEVEGGILYNFLSDYYFIVGLRFDRLSMYLNDPSDQSGIYQGYLQTGYQDLYTSDMNVKTWIPYFGVRIKGSNYKADLLYSPFSSANVELPFRYRFDNAPLGGPYGGSFSFQQEYYTMNKLGTFLEGSFQYCAAIINSFGFDLWTKGSYLSVKGDGNEDSTTSNPFSTNSANAQGSFNTYSLSGGIGVSLSL